jgi:hypothetical protein
VVALYAVTLFISALLVFVVQPMFSKLLLPYLGGTPTVWNASLFFFQVALLGGYLYTHLLTRFVPGRRQQAGHLLLLAGSLLLLPIALPSGWAPSSGLPAALAVVAVLAMSIGVPFVMLSATAPLLQHWFSRSTHHSASHPYFLYAASNAGSLIALIAFPVLIEPTLSGGQQRSLWSVGYGLLVACVLLCVLVSRRNGWSEVEVQTAKEGPDDKSVDALVRARWVILAAVPSSLLLGATTYLTTDIAAVPLLWIIPLTLYLLSFVLTFARRQVIRQEWMLTLQTLLVVLLVLQLFWRVTLPSWHPLVLPPLLLFASAMICHRELVKRAPDRRHLTEFYLWIALGGALGGMFNALLAPLAFNWIAEFPIALVAACLLRPERSNTAGNSERRRVLDLALPLLLALGLAAYHFGYGLTFPRNFPIGFLVVSFVVALILIFSSARPVRLGLAVVVLVVVGRLVGYGEHEILFTERSFFGLHQVARDTVARANLLFNGTTLHGAQRLEPQFRRIPQSYYDPTGPLGQAMSSIIGLPRRQVALIGLGTGALACYARANERWVFYEIDPAIVRIARNPKYFSFLSDCKPDADVVLGDGRIRLQDAPAAAFDVIVMDAFTSDAIPVHLLTREAMALYVEKLTPTGVLFVHLSNRYLDLAPVVARTAETAGLSGMISVTPPPGQDRTETAGARDGTWAVLARKRELLGALLEDPRWAQLQAPPGTSLWTDDFSNVLQVMRW